MTWYPYCAGGTPDDVTDSVPISARPIICRTAATRKRWKGGILALETRYPDNAEPRGEHSMSASSHQPASNAERWLTT